MGRGKKALDVNFWVVSAADAHVTRLVAAIGRRQVSHLARALTICSTIVMLNNDISARIAQVVKGAPEWVRSDLASHDASSRERAEETIAAMIASALASDDAHNHQENGD